MVVPRKVIVDIWNKIEAMEDGNEKTILKWRLIDEYKPDQVIKKCEEAGIRSRVGTFYTRRSIERIDVNGNYEPNNCKWATFREQANNRRTNTVVGYNGEENTLSQWAERLGMNYSTFMSRYSRGWSIERIITQPVKRKFNGA